MCRRLLSYSVSPSFLREAMYIIINVQQIMCISSQEKRLESETRKCIKPSFCVANFSFVLFSTGSASRKNAEFSAYVGNDNCDALLFSDRKIRLTFTLSWTDQRKTIDDNLIPTGVENGGEKEATKLFFEMKQQLPFLP